MAFSPLILTRAVSKFALFFLIGLASFNLSAQTSGLHIGAYHEDPTANPEDPTPGLLYLNLPAGDQSFKGLMDFTFVGCQSKSVGEIKGEKIKGSLKGEWSGQVDYTFQTGSYNGRYIAKDKYYTGTYAVDKGKQFVKVPNCIEYYIAPHGTWSIFELNHTFSESKPFEPISVVDGVAKWSMPPGTTIASISLVDKELAVSGAKNAVLHQLIIPASLKNYQLPAQYAKSGKTYVISVIASNGRKVVYFSSIEFPGKSGGKRSGRDVPPVIKGGSASADASENVKDDSNPVMDGNEPASDCAGSYEGAYEGFLAGHLKVSISDAVLKNNLALSGVATSNLQDARPFPLTGIANKNCEITFKGTWQAWVFHEGKRYRELYFKGSVDGDEMNGEYWLDEKRTGSSVGSFSAMRDK